MTIDQLKEKIRTGEDSSTQFKADVHNADSLAAEMVAFANGIGGTIYIGVSDDGTLTGILPEDVRRINQLIGNAASQHVRSPLTVHTANIAIDNDKLVIALTIPVGIDKPYFDKNGTIWFKNGSDKRKINSKEELRRLFQASNLIYADETPTNAQISALDTDYFSEFLLKNYHQSLPESADNLQILLNNMGLAVADKLTLSAVLLFAKKPQFILPMFICKTVSYMGTSVTTGYFLDNEDFEGRLDSQYQGVLTFIMRNLKKVQAPGASVNSPGVPEIPRTVFEELIVNALIHRDYFINAPIRVFVFTDRIELISPGSLPNHLNITKIEAGNSVIRNPLLASFAFKGVLPYRGLGTGIRRALSDWPSISFIDDKEENLFKVIVYRKNQT